MLFWRQKTLLLTVICMVASLNLMAATTTVTITNPGPVITLAPFSQSQGNLYEIISAVNAYPTITANGNLLQGGNFRVVRLRVTSNSGLVVYGGNQAFNNITLESQTALTSLNNNPAVGVILINSGTISLQGGSSIIGSINFDLNSAAPIILNTSDSGATALTGDIVNPYNISSANFTLNMGSTNIIGSLGTTYPLTSATISMPGSGSITGNVYTSGATSITNSSSGNIVGNITAGSATISLTGTGNINGSMALGSGSLTVSGSKATGGTISGLSNLSITGSSTTYTLNHNVSVATGVTLASNTSLVVNSAMSGGATISNSGIIAANASLPTGAITNSGLIKIAGSISLSNNITNTGTISIFSGSNSAFSGAVSGSSGILNLGGNIDGTNTSGTLNLNSGASIAASQTLTLFNSSALNINGTATVSTAITGSTSGGLANNTTLGFGTTLAAPSFTTAASISYIKNITIGSGSTVTFANSVTGVTNFTNSGTANINSTFTGSSGTITNNGSITLNSSNSLTGFPNIILGSGSSLNIPVSYSLSGVTITGSSAPAQTGSINISSAAAVTADSPISYLSAINLTGTSSLITTSSIVNIGTVSIANGTTLELSGHASVSSFGTLAVNGVFKIDSGASFTLSANQNITGSGSTGQIKNYGQLTLDGSNVTFPGSFFNYNSGTFTINGEPSLKFTGGTFGNQGTIKANFSTTNSLPQITTDSANPDLAAGAFNIGYNNNYIAGGDYTLFYAPNHAGPTAINPGAPILPQPSFYISSFSLTSTPTTVSVTVVRDGFDKHALNPSAASIGAYLEQLGKTSHDPSILGLLNALEKITNDQQLTAALDSLLPPQYTALVTLEMLDYTLGALDIRLASMKNNYGYGAGDIVVEDKNGAWVRAFSTHGKQSASGTLEAYTDKNHGWIFGLDRSLNDSITLGVAGSISKTSVQETLDPGSTTNINNYEIMLYGTLKSQNDSYLDAVICGGNSNYHGVRSINFPGYQAYAYANYSSQQLTLKAMASRIFTWQDLLQFTPRAMAQYSFMRQLAYTETNAGPYSTYNNPNNINLFRLGAGADLGIPFTTRKIISIPSVYTMVYVDAKGGVNTTNTQFIGGGPVIVNSVQASRMMLKFGASYGLKFNKNFELVANYDYIVRSGFKGHETFLNLRYIF